MKYVTDAAREYAKRKVKDNKIDDLSNLLSPLLTAKYDTLFKIQNLIDDFNSKWSTQIDKIERNMDFEPGAESILLIDIDALEHMLRYKDSEKSSFEIEDLTDEILSELDEDE